MGFNWVLKGLNTADSDQKILTVITASTFRTCSAVGLFTDATFVSDSQRGFCKRFSKTWKSPENFQVPKE
jgi:hypothetical protein